MSKFGTLRFVASLLHVLAWVFLVLGLVSALGIVIVAIIGGQVDISRMGRMGLNMQPLVSALFLGLMTAVGTLLSFVALNANADAINLALSIEENTRKTADLLAGDAALGATPPPWESK